MDYIDQQPSDLPVDFTQLRVQTGRGERKVEDLIDEVRNRRGENGIFRRITSWIRSALLKQGVGSLLKSVSNKDLNRIYELANKNFDGQLNDYFRAKNSQESPTIVFLQKVEKEIEKRKKVLAVWEDNFPPLGPSASLEAQLTVKQIEVAAIAASPVSIGNRVNVALGTLEPITASTITSVLSQLISSKVEDYPLISDLAAVYGAKVLDYEFLRKIVEQVPNKSERRKAAVALAAYAIKCFGHEFGIGGNLRIGKHELATEGWQQHITHVKLESSFADFMQTSSVARQIDSKTVHTITQSIQKAVRLSEGICSDHEIELALQAYQRKEPVVIPTGWFGHATEIVLFNGVLAYANRGQATDDWSSGIAFYSIQKPENINKEFIRRLIEMSSSVLKTQSLDESAIREEALNNLAKNSLQELERQDAQKVAMARKNLKVSKEDIRKEILEIKKNRVISPVMRFYETPSEENGMHELLGLVPFYRFNPNTDLKKAKSALVMKKVSSIIHQKQEALTKTLRLTKLDAYQREAQERGVTSDEAQAIATKRIEKEARSEAERDFPFLVAEEEKSTTDAEVLIELARRKDANKLAKADQKVGNCTWASTKCGFEALLYLTQMKHAVEHYNATKQTDAVSVEFPPVLPGSDHEHQSQEYVNAYLQVMKEAEIFRSRVYSAWSSAHRIAELDNVLHFIAEIDRTYHLFSPYEKYKFIAQLFFKFANTTKLSKYSDEDTEIVSKLQSVAHQIYRHEEFAPKDALQDISMLSAKDCDRILRQFFSPSKQGEPGKNQFSEGAFTLMKVNAVVKVDNIIQKNPEGKPIEEAKVKLFYIMGGKRHELELEMEGTEIYVKPFGNTVRLPFYTLQDLSDYLKNLNPGFKGLSLPIHNQKAIDRKLSGQAGLD